VQVPLIFLHFLLYKGRSINKLQNDIILLIFKIWKFRNIRFVWSLIEDIYGNFMTMTSLLWHYWYLEHSQSVHYFAQQCASTTRHVLNSVAADEKSEQVQQANVFKRQTLTFHFLTYRPNSFKHLWHHTPGRSDRMRESTAAVVETRRLQGHSSSTTLFRFFDHEQTFCTKYVLLVS